MSDTLNFNPTELASQINVEEDSSLKEIDNKDIENNDNEVIEDTTNENKEDVVVDENDNNDISQPTEVKEQVLDDDLVRSKAKELGFISEDDLELYKEEWQKTQIPESESDFIKKIKQLETEGYNPNDIDYWKFVSKDYGKYDTTNQVDAFELVLEGEKFDNPDIPESDLRRKLELDYDELFDEDTDESSRSYKRQELDLGIKARSYQKKLKEAQSKAMPPKNAEKQQEIIQQKQEQEFKAFLPKAERQYKQRINKHLSENKVYDVKVGDEIIQYEFSKENVAKLKDSFNGIFEANARGLVDANGIKDGYVKDNDIAVTLQNIVWSNPEIRSGIVDKIYEHAESKSDKKVVEELSNTTLPTSEPRPEKAKGSLDDSFGRITLRMP